MNEAALAYLERLGSLGLLSLVLFGIYRVFTGRIVAALDRIVAQLDNLNVRVTSADTRLEGIERTQLGEIEDHARMLRRIDRIAGAVDAETTGVRPLPGPRESR